MRSKVIRNKGHLIKAWVVWQVNKWTKIWTMTMYTCLCATVNIYFHIFHLKMKTDKNHYYYFWLKSIFKWIWYLYYFSLWVNLVFLWNNFTKIHTEIVYNVHLYLYWHNFIITSCLLKLLAFSWIVFSVCEVCTLEEELITCIIFLLWPWQ